MFRKPPRRNLLPRPLSLCEPLEPRQLLAATLVADLDLNPASSNPANLANINGTLYFSASSAGSGQEIWTSDGTPQGTSPFLDLNPGTASSNPANFTNVNGAIYFTADDGLHGTELWKTDGTPQGTTLVQDLNPGSAPSTFIEFLPVGNSLYFVARTTGTYTLWKTDGTTAGAVALNSSLGLSSTRPSLFLTDVNGTLFFSNGELWKTDGTPEGTVMVKDIDPRTTPPTGSNPFPYPGPFYSLPSNLVSYNRHLYFTATNAAGTGLWKSDGTEAGTVLVKVIPDAPMFFPSDRTNAIVIDDTLYFTLQSSTYTATLFKSDGTAEGTVVVKDLQKGTASQLTNLNGKLVFTVADYQNVFGLWASDGTAAGTTLLGSFGITTPSSSEGRLVRAGDYLFFSANHRGDVELWMTNGTASGTTLVRDIYPGWNGSSYNHSRPADIIESGGKVLFAATNPSTGRELWQSDGTFWGTTLFLDLEPLGSNPRSLITSNNTLFFTTGDSIYRSDGASAGTTPVKKLPAENLVDVNGTIFFSVPPGSSDSGLWKTDGTPEGTVRIHSVYAQDATNINGTLFFLSRDPSGYMVLWKSDGTPSGTVSVRSIAHESIYISTRFIEFKGSAYFVVRRHDNYCELWKSNGTPAGTICLQYGSGVYQSIAKTSTSLLFIEGNGIWEPSGTDRMVLVRSFYPYSPRNLTTSNNLIFFTLDTGALFKSDGTTAGTTFISRVQPYPGNPNPQNLTDVSGRLFFTADDGVHGNELWLTDGTPEGTRLVKDITPGPAGTLFQNLTSFAGQLFFQAYHPETGFELWRSDGTPEGTVLVKDIYPGPGSSNPSNFAVANNTLYYSASDPLHGTELWKLSPPTANPGGPYTTVLGSLTPLDASASSDPDPAETLTYAWDIDHDGLFDDATGPNPAFFPTIPGLHTLSLRVTNSAGLSSIASTTLYVSRLQMPLYGTDADDTLLLRLNPTATQLQYFLNTPTDQQPSTTVPFGSVGQMPIDTFAGQDQLCLDLAYGQPLAPVDLILSTGQLRLTLVNGTLARLSSLTLSPTATLDLTTHSLHIANTPLSDLQAYLQSHRLYSSSATQYTTLAPFPQPDGSILIKLTYYGDTNNDGTVNLTDYFTIDSGYLNKRTGFTHGDVNLDGEINLTDYFLIDSAYLNQQPPLASSSSSTRTKKVLKAPKKKPKIKPTFSSKKRIH